MTVKVPLEIKELVLQISGRPDQRAVETFAAYRADQAFDERVRERHVRHRLDGFHVKDSQIRLPLVESVQRIMVRAEIRRRRLATSGSIEHLAERHAVHDAGVHAEAHDAARQLVHHDEHPVRVEDGRFAPARRQLLLPFAADLIVAAQSYVPYQPAHGMFTSWVAALDIALVFKIFKGDVRLT
jgi:hypothetical protein